MIRKLFAGGLLALALVFGTTSAAQAYYPYGYGGYGNPYGGGYYNSYSYGGFNRGFVNPGYGYGYAPRSYVPFTPVFGANYLPYGGGFQPRLRLRRLPLRRRWLRLRPHRVLARLQLHPLSAVWRRAARRHQSAGVFARRRRVNSWPSR